MGDTENKTSHKDKKRMVKALFSYSPVNIDELQLKVNDILEVIEETEEGWWKGILNGNVGMFPSNFVIEMDGLPEEFNNHKMNELSPTKIKTKIKNVDIQDSGFKRDIIHSPSIKHDVKPVNLGANNEDEIDASKGMESSNKKISVNKRNVVDSTAPRLPPKPVREQARVIYPYAALNEDELSLKEGDIITVISKEVEDKGWWKGELNNRMGVFPDNFVQLIKVEEQKKPERPDKPSTALSSKASLRSSSEKGASEVSPKIDKKGLKTPPAKPPPPEVHRKEIERPSPPFPGKKPQVPHPMKKPTRSSLGTKFTAFSPPVPSNSAKNPIPENCHAAAPVLVPTAPETKSLSKSVPVAETKSLSKSVPAAETKSLLKSVPAVESKSLSKSVPATETKSLSKSVPAAETKALSKSVPAAETKALSKSVPAAETKSLSKSVPAAENKSLSKSAAETKPSSKSVAETKSLSKTVPVAETRSEVTKNVNKHSEKEDRKNNQDSAFEGLESSGKKLVHLTANRAKVPHRRPPSHIFLRETEKENGVSSSDPRRLSEPLLSEMKSIMQLGEIELHKTSVAVASEIKAKVPPSRPLPPSIRGNKPALQGSLILTKTISSEECIVKAPEPIKKSVLPDASTCMPSTEILQPKQMDIASSDFKSQLSDIELQELKDNLKSVMESVVSRNEFNELAKQVRELKEALEKSTSNCKQTINELKSELEHERKQRQALEVELQQMKESQNT